MGFAPAAPHEIFRGECMSVSTVRVILLRRSRGLTAPAAWAPPAGVLPPKDPSRYHTDELAILIGGGAGRGLCPLPSNAPEKLC